MNHIIVGTAGHIDHGKTALVRALTGIDTDRLQEEKERGISIDLGFAHLDLGNGISAGLVDVPGHERFVRNMLAGATGIDVALLVVAATESVMPQTREHFEICRMLGIPRAIVALTKIDLADEVTAGIAADDIRRLAAGSFLEDAPIVPVSAVTGEGLDSLRRALVEAAAAVRPKDRSSIFRMPVDRVFAMKGFGTVVTGTIAAGTIRAGDEIEIYPQSLRVRVRGIQNHGRSVEEAIAGQRAALNLAGTGVDDLHRGSVIGAAGLLWATSSFGARVELLASSPRLRDRSPVHFHAGAAEIEGELRWLDRDEVQAGSSAYARIVLRVPTVLLPGDRFVLRRFSPVETIGGGVVLDPHLPQERRATLHAQLAKLDAADATARLQQWASGEFGTTAADLTARSGLSIHDFRLSGLIEVGDRLLTPEGVALLRNRMAATVAEFHQHRSLASGIPKEELRMRALPGLPPALLDFVLRDHPDLITGGDIVRHRDFERKLNSAEDGASRAIEEAFRTAGLAAPATTEVLGRTGLDLKKATALLQGLLREGRLARISSELVVHASAMESLRAIFASRQGTRFGVAEFKAWTGVSRKFAIPLLEYCDRQRITRREGDSRLVL